MITAAAAAATLPFLSSFHRSRLRSSPRHRVLPPQRASDSPSASWEREEARWLREEQRWLRDEQRWLREEARWHAEREALLAELVVLRRRLHALEPLAALDAVAAPAPERLPVPPSSRPALAEEAEEKRVVHEEVAAERRGRRTLRAGAEGADVRAMQEALEKLGFYSGEEDMEFSSFSSGTERAVKTWQATIGTSENGVMTSELLERLFTEQAVGDVKTEDRVNGATVTALSGIAEVQQAVVKESGDSKVEVSQHRVFLIGENRWEDPSRLTQKNKPISTATTASAKKCISCRGEGRLMCTECDGTGEPNIEPQFLEWVGEDMKCPYCEGLGSIICDVCEGKTVVES